MFRIILVLLTLVVSNPTLGRPSLTDDAVRQIVEDAWKKSTLVVPLGPFMIVRDDAIDMANGRLSEGSHKELVIWQKTGLIEVHEDQQYKNFRNGKGFSWNQWNQLGVQGVQKKIVVNATKHGRQFIVNGPSKTWKALSGKQRLEIPQGKFTVTKILKNEEREKSAESYRLIFLVYDAVWKPESKEFLSQIGERLAEKRKAMILLKYDAFDSSWKVIKEDYANADEEFETSTATRALAN